MHGWRECTVHLGVKLSQSNHALPGAHGVDFHVGVGLALSCYNLGVSVLEHLGHAVHGAWEAFLCVRACKQRGGWGGVTWVRPWPPGSTIAAKPMDAPSPTLAMNSSAMLLRLLRVASVAVIAARLAASLTILRCPPSLHTLLSPAHVC